MKPILEINNISKIFRIQHERQPYLSIRDSLSGFLKSESKSSEDFYALQDVSFNVDQGDTIGIVGKNGAGKSTLLKILSKITPPTSGKIISRGRIASLLEVGTGFHPELSGRENVYLNGSILGMKREEIHKNFDAIVDFAGIEKFIDTPLKHYSSGMQLRLAFAVAAFLENEILIIDEVLAVGDAEFQKKCMGKMEAVSKSGRTILFVSHNMGAITQLCEKAVLLKQGQLILNADTKTVLNSYINSDNNELDQFTGKLEVNRKIVKSVELKCNDIVSNVFFAGCTFMMEVKFESTVPLDFPVLGIIINDEYNQPVIGINNKHYSGNQITKEVNKGTFKITIPFFPLFSGRYSVDLHFGNAHTDMEVLRNVFVFFVEKNGIKGGIEMPSEKFNKILIERVNWEVKNDEN
ncbi:MAG: ABC transporter ATP-binding protein [Bacteroidetes bacterium]|nr:ABC transporter ATP-binding protein [Bacteroidota bacterium]